MSIVKVNFEFARVTRFWNRGFWLSISLRKSFEDLGTFKERIMSAY